MLSVCSNWCMCVIFFLQQNQYSGIPYRKFSELSLGFWKLSVWRPICPLRFRFVTVNASPFFEGIMRADKSHKSMVSMMNVYENTEMQTFGNTSQIFLTIFLSLPWWMDRYVLLKTFLLIFFEMYLKDRDRESFHPLVRSPDDCNSQDGDFIHFSHLDTGTWDISLWFSSSINRELDWNWNSLNTNQCPYGIPPSWVVVLLAMPQHLPLATCSQSWDPIIINSCNYNIHLGLLCSFDQSRARNHRNEWIISLKETQISGSSLLHGL